MSALEGRRPAELLSGDDDPMLDVTPDSDDAGGPLDDEDRRVTAAHARMCPTCRLLAKPMCLHVSVNGADSVTESTDSRTVSSHGDYQPLIQEDGHQELQQDLYDSHCHGQPSPSSSKREALLRLGCTAIFCFCFMVGEWLGGYFANSLAVMSDAAHLLSDFGSFLLSIFAIWLSMQRPTQKMTFGYFRAEILGAVTSVLTIWVVTAVLVYMAVERMSHGHYDIDADTMLIVSGIGVAVNVLMGAVLHGRCLGSGGHGHSHGLGGGRGHSHGHDARSADVSQNINVRAATVHILGDLIQSIGVLVSAVIIKFKPEYRVADPICTLLFSAIVMATTVGVMRDAIQVLMEATPPDIQYSAVQRDLETIEGVVKVHDLNIWSLNVDRFAVTVHLAKDSSADGDQVLRTALALLKLRHHFASTTIQVEPYDSTMDVCDACLLPSR